MLWEIALGHPKQWRIHLQPPDNGGQTLPGSLSLEMVAQRGEIAAPKPLSFSSLLTSRTDSLPSYRLSWEKYIPEIKESQPLLSKLNHPARAGLGVSLPLPKPSCSMGNSKEDLTLSSLSVRDSFAKTSQDNIHQNRGGGFPRHPAQVLRSLFFPDTLPDLVFPQLHGLSKYFLEVHSKVRLLWFVIMSLFK